MPWRLPWRVPWRVVDVHVPAPHQPTLCLRNVQRQRQLGLRKGSSRPLTHHRGGTAARDLLQAGRALSMVARTLGCIAHL